MRKQTSKDKAKQTGKTRKTAALTIAFPVVVVFLSVFFFAIAYLLHDCADEECYVCAQIHRVSETWQRFWSSMAGVSSIAAACAAVAPLLLSRKRQPLEPSTPVSVKIRLND
ncbi:MAG: hypothetical protein LBO68_01610 [Synergistaceae bacterium]|jgi:ABC-type Fe3+ transport system permease subunit|nr:hypothetical protein [Synergistaceae bacterium]